MRREYTYVAVEDPDNVMDFRFKVDIPREVTDRVKKLRHFSQ